MSAYTRYYNKNKQAYLVLAEHWIRWASTAQLTHEEREGITKFFYRSAVRFGLVKAFKELGVIK
jgi:hypothetical protein